MGEGEPSQEAVNQAEAEADAAALLAEEAAQKLADTLGKATASLTPADIAAAAQAISAAVAAARMAVDGARRTGALGAADALRKALDVAMKRHAAHLLAQAKTPGPGEAVRSGLAAAEAAKALKSAGLLPKTVAALEEAAEAAQAAAMAGAGADAVTNDPNARTRPGPQPSARQPP